MMSLLTQQGQLIAEHVEVADSLLSRMQGLLGRRELPARHALWIQRCNSVHTFCMRFSIDVLFVDRALAIVGIHRALPAWRITFPIANADSVFELPAGCLSAEVKVGDRLKVVESTTHADAHTSFPREI
jgi:uncharacterized membrane protein (UPF0127 family)